MNAETLNDRLKEIVAHPDKPLASLTAIAFVNGEIAYEGYFGWRYIDAERPSKNLPVNQDTKFRVASISKLVATLGVMQLVAQNQLDLTRDISDYLGFSIRNPYYPDIPITTRMLLSHTSSIRDQGESYILPLPHTMQDYFGPAGSHYAYGLHWAPRQEIPGFYFSYSNLNFGLIGTLIESISGERFDQYMRRHLFEPLRLEASYNVLDFSDEAMANLAVLYRKQAANGKWNASGPWFPQIDDYQGQRPETVIRIEADESPNQDAPSLDDYVIGTNGTLFSPQGGLRISGRDLAKIALLMANEGMHNGIQVLQPSSIKQMLQPTWTYNPTTINGNTYEGLMRCWGLGVQLISNTAGDRLVNGADLAYIGHGGDAYGLLSGLWLDPKTSSGFVYCIGGVGANPATHRGEYSSFYRWEEDVMTALYEAVIK